MKLRLVQPNDWSDDFNLAPVDEPVLLFHKDWIQLDFNPNGVIEGFWTDMFGHSGWMGAVWDDNADEYMTIEVFPSHWMYMPKGPTS